MKRSIRTISTLLTYLIIIIIVVLCYLTIQTDILLRRHLAEAIAMCSKWGNNAKRFCDEGAVKPMVEYLGSHDITVQRSAMRALEQLGKSPESCIIMHRGGVVKVTFRCAVIPPSNWRPFLSNLPAEISRSRCATLRAKVFCFLFWFIKRVIHAISVTRKTKHPKV